MPKCGLDEWDEAWWLNRLYDEAVVVSCTSAGFVGFPLPKAAPPLLSKMIHWIIFYASNYG